MDGDTGIMTKLEYFEELLILIKENSNVPVRIKAGSDDCLNDDFDWFLLEFTGKPELSKLFDWNDRLYDDESSAREQIEGDYDGDLEGPELEQLIDAEIEKIRKPVILLTVTGTEI